MKQSKNVFGVALNHRILRAKMEESFHTKPHLKPPTTPVLFIKPDNTHINQGDKIPFPSSNETIFAGPALGIVIGKTTHRIKTEQANSYIEGYVIVNEVSLAEDSFYRPAIKAKCRDGFCPISATINANMVSNPESLKINTYINDELKHSTSTEQLYYSFNELIEFISSFITLEKGDVIITATPIRDETLALKAGDTVSIEIEQLGRLENYVVAEQEL